MLGFFNLSYITVSLILLSLFAFHIIVVLHFDNLRKMEDDILESYIEITGISPTTSSNDDEDRNVILSRLSQVDDIKEKVRLSSKLSFERRNSQKY